METIKNFSKCNINEVYTINGKELIFTEISIKKSGSCKHNLYTGSLDGEPFKELNSPQLKRRLGIDTIEYNRAGGDGTPKPRKEITPESIDAEVAKLDARCDALNETIIKLLGDEPTDVVRHVLWDLVEQKKKHLREELEGKMMMQMAKAKDAEKDEERKQLCAELGTTLSAVKKMAEGMQMDLDAMIASLQAMKK